MNGYILSFWTFTVNSLSLGFSLLLDAIPISLTFFLLLGKEDQLIVLTITLTLAFYIFAFGFLVGIQEAIGLRCPVLFGQKNHSAFSASLYRFALINGIMVSVSIVIVLSSFSILEMINIDPELSQRVYRLMLVLLPVKILENVTIILKGVLLSQKVFKPSVTINVIALLVFSCMGMLLIRYMDLEITGFTIALYSKVVTETFMLLLTIEKYISTEYLRCPSFTEIRKDFLSELKFTAFVSLSQYGE